MTKAMIGAMGFSFEAAPSHETPNATRTMVATRHIGVSSTSMASRITSPMSRAAIAISASARTVLRARSGFHMKKVT